MKNHTYLQRCMRNLLCITCLLGITFYALAAQKTLSERPDIQKFIHYMVEKHNFNPEQLKKTFNKAQIQTDIIKRIKNPYEDKPWNHYQALFLTNERTEQGLEFWKKHETVLARAEREFGVPAGIIVAILGIETSYGKTQGEHRVIDALTTLAFEYPPRAPFFKKELEHFLLLSHEQQLDPFSVYGSYAGAIGQAQFIPSSYRHYALDYTGNGKKDLRHTTEDAIGSIANYLKKNGWHNRERIAAPAKVDTVKLGALNEVLQQQLTIAELANHGIHTEQKVPRTILAKLISLEGDKRTEYWLGFNNFRVIMRYNTSKKYAAAVCQLAERITHLREQYTG